jgi:hypothetical protein
MDAKARQILFRTYWSGGWTDRDWQSASPEDFAYAKAQGIMFDPVTWTHDENVACVQPFREPRFAQVAAAGLVAAPGVAIRAGELVHAGAAAGSCV